ncbi:glutathione S-transferase [Loktanella ponticola]|uniref:Glutathione S-transferase n=1 Tax=Yoonia ponticola TaxID=1524255 RepID=A0A7W9EWC5_9RHOB|nr:glutathione S-transferase [Yoonia ponticola]MBB5720547.1 glutathione S-transferase [Yoonia ponticola]
MSQTPVLWSFRRCPYAMRARLTILYTGVKMDLRDILLKDKPAEMTDVSPKATVPVLNTGTEVIEESRDIMLWALAQNDPHGWLDMPAEGYAMIDTNDGPFKRALDHTKYAVRFPDRDATADRAKAADVLFGLNDRLVNQPHLFGDAPKMVDTAILPFVRQFANTDRDWFNAQDWPHLIRWLTAFETSDSFKVIMVKRPIWEPGAAPSYFP